MSTKTSDPSAPARPRGGETDQRRIHSGGELKSNRSSRGRPRGTQTMYTGSGTENSKLSRVEARRAEAGREEENP